MAAVAAAGDTPCPLSEETLEQLLLSLDRERDQAKISASGSDSRSEELNSYTIFEAMPLEMRIPLVEAAMKIPGLDRAMGSVCGMAVGDGLGHPLEFLPAQSEVHAGFPHFDLETCTFHAEKNANKLQRGQWTDDASMGLCVADSLLMKRSFDGSDMRTRFWCWWNRGYGNAFRKDKKRKNRRSVGLGGNIRKSLGEVWEFASKGERPPPFVGSGEEDAGNGSLMRFAPIAVFTHAASVQEVLDMSRSSSYTTHPGIIAAQACSFLGHLIVSALRLPEGAPADVKAFLEQAANEYLKVSGLEGKSGPGYDQMKWLVTSTPVKATEKCWDWRSEKLDIQGTLKARGESYNGYPVSDWYFGSYAMDGLALALWSVYNSHSFDDAVTRSINLLGDADSHGSITGQLAGAIYGYRSINPQFLKWLNEWDDHEFALRAILLHYLGSKTSKRAVAAQLPSPISASTSAPAVVTPQT